MFDTLSHWSAERRQVNTDSITSIAIHTANWNRKQFWRVFGTPNTSSQNHIRRESLNCSYARSSQRNLRDNMNSANQKSAKTTSTSLSEFVATVLTI
jgi:hypothetical protein